MLGQLGISRLRARGTGYVFSPRMRGTCLAAQAHARFALSEIELRQDNRACVRA